MHTQINPHHHDANCGQAGVAVHQPAIEPAPAPHIIIQMDALERPETDVFETLAKAASHGSGQGAQQAAPSSAPTPNLISHAIHKPYGAAAKAADARKPRVLGIPLPTSLASPTRWADALWYAGHVMSVGSLLSRYNLPAAALLVGVGQVLVIVSRPIGRIPCRQVRQAEEAV